jgi:hypothetical protein
VCVLTWACIAGRAREAFNRVQKANELLKAGPSIVAQHAAFVRKQVNTNIFKS